VSQFQEKLQSIARMKRTLGFPLFASRKQDRSTSRHIERFAFGGKNGKKKEENDTKAIALRRGVPLFSMRNAIAFLRAGAVTSLRIDFVQCGAYAGSIRSSMERKLRSVTLRDLAATAA